MICEKILGNIKEYSGDYSIIKVMFEWYEIGKKRIVKCASDGKEIAIAVDSFDIGDILTFENGKAYVVDVNPCDVIKVDVTEIEEMGRLCFELGNRHLSLKITDKIVLIPYDEPTYEYLIKLGFKVTKTKEVFVDYILCKAHGNSHTHSHEYHHD